MQDQNLKTWRCGRCGLAVDLPDHEAEYDLFVAAMNRIREHRWAHLVTAFEDGSDAALDRLCDDGPAQETEPFSFGPPLAEPVDSDDVAPVLVGIAQLLRADLLRARRLWYPINKDGSFNREENK